MSTNQRAKDKELRILRAAVAVFARRGYHASSISDVADEAGVAAGTIYLYFSRKEELLVRMFERFIGGYLEECRPDLLATPAGLPRLRRLLELHLTFFARDKSLARAFELHLREVNPVIREGIRPTLRSYFEVIEQVIEQGARRRVYDSNLDVRLARRVLFGGLEEVVTSWVLSHGDHSLLGVLDPLFAMIGRALGADPAEVAAVSAVAAAGSAGASESSSKETKNVG